jgi:outer membrane protein assembly factor BamB
MRMKTLVHVLLLILATNAGADSNAPGWPVFRGNPALTGVAGGSLSSNLVPRWSFKAGDSIRSSPVVGYGRVFFGSQDGKIYALNRADGVQAWSFEAGAPVDAPPLLDNGLVFVGDMNGIFHALSAGDGREVWRFQTGAQIVGSANRLEGSRNGLIVVGSHDFFLYALDPRSGRKIWSHASESFINGAPAVAVDRVVVGGCDAKVRVLSAADGTGFAVDAGSYIAGSAAVSSGRAFVGHYGNQLVCVNLTEQRIEWAFGSADTGDPFFAAPAVDERSVVAGCRDGNVYCLEKATGRELWRFSTGGQVDSSPVICDGKVIAGSNDGVLYMLDLATGAKRWTFEAGRPIVSSPAVVDGEVFVGADDGRMYAFGERETRNAERGTSNRR